MRHERPALLDVNVLIALFDPDHVHHGLAHDWFADNRTHGWATCPLTENGFVRVLANPAYWHRDDSIGRTRIQAANVLRQWTPFILARCRLASQRDHVRPGGRRGHRQLTDVYLLGLATQQAGRLVTFDRTIPIAAVVGADASVLTVVTAD